MPDAAPFISRRQTLSLAGLATLGGVLVSPTMADDIVSIDQELTDLRSTYELTPLAVTVPALKGLHERALFLGHRRGHPTHRSALNAVTSRVGALRADALYNAGEVSLSRRISGHAASLGKLSGDPHTYANARRTQAAIEVYEGRPAFAMAYANQADEHTPAGVACMASKARGAALAGVGADDVYRLADEALNAAYGLPGHVHGTPGDEDPQTCSPAEVAYSATLASAVAGDLFRADGYADLALPHLPAGFRSVILAHLAVASVPVDLDRAVAEARKSLALSPTPFRSLSVPLANLVKALRPYRHSAPDVMVLAQEIDAWRGPTATAPHPDEDFV